MKFISNHFHKILLSTFALLSFFNLINCLIFKIHIILLSENQILYIYSSLAQVIGALLGLTIAGYSIIDSKMKSLSETDITVTEYVEDVRSNYFVSLMFIIILSTINIIICLVVIAIFDNSFDIFSPFFMTESIIIFIFIMIELIHFVYYLNPMMINEKGSTDKDSIDAEYNHQSNSSDSNENFSPFVTDYNILEHLIKEFACHLIDSPNSKHKLQFFDSLNILLRYEVINPEIYSIIDEFRRYRNALVHSLDTDKSVNPLIYQKLVKIHKLLKSVYDASTSDNKDEFNVRKEELISYSKTHGYNELDRKIIDYLTTHPNASSRDISGYTNYSLHSINQRLGNLQRMGAISKAGEGKQSSWQVNTNNQ